ncbi:hypothetical protein [Mesorhizobium sp.]|uniref:hypothetical protein n=1 Tax=Mesorhizobium sp. TaxID=1871066 RepID=UPI000FE590A3|nr:hypothetical protein [Mesorhizobium sp.]RWM06965.1 MAG: hypothetical protein EOR71_17955 [Mesorhizobium sp.]
MIKAQAYADFMSRTVVVAIAVVRALILASVNLDLNPAYFNRGFNRPKNIVTAAALTVVPIVLTAAGDDLRFSLLDFALLWPSGPDAGWSFTLPIIFPLAAIASLYVLGAIPALAAERARSPFAFSASPTVRRRLGRIGGSLGEPATPSTTWLAKRAWKASSRNGWTASTAAVRR